MKNVILCCVTLLLAAASFSSCKKCYSCDFGNNDVREFCSKDFPDGTDGLKMTINAYEEQGYECTQQ